MCIYDPLFPLSAVLGNHPTTYIHCYEHDLDREPRILVDIDRDLTYICTSKLLFSTTTHLSHLIDDTVFYTKTGFRSVDLTN